jgi:methylthioribose-1-phosphate isomerase
MQKVAAQLKATRPTAVNLSWAVERCLERLRQTPPHQAAEQLRALADELAEGDVRANLRLSRYGAELIPAGANVLTHCNTGSLATVEYGTALGSIRAASEAGKQIHVYVDETRPFLQGARLTIWELQRLGIPATLITDNMAGYFMAMGRVDLVIVGADRIARNGDTANKIGTYSLAVLCRAHEIPFYVAATTATIDMAMGQGSSIPIEERAAEEVTHLFGHRIAPQGTRASNPAFDVTPARLISAIITEEGICTPPYEVSLARALRRSVSEPAEVVR